MTFFILRGWGRIAKHSFQTRKLYFNLLEFLHFPHCHHSFLKNIFASPNLTYEAFKRLPIGVFVRWLKIYCKDSVGKKLKVQLRYSLTKETTWYRVPLVYLNCTKVMWRKWWQTIFIKGQHYSKFHVIYEYDILEEWDIVHPLPVQILYVKKSSMVEILMKFALTFLMHWEDWE